MAFSDTDPIYDCMWSYKHLRSHCPVLTVGWTKCVGSNSNSLAKITRGVPQGSPMIPTLFNIFMDVLAERIEPNNKSDENSGIILFVEEAQLTAKSRIALQRNPRDGFHVVNWNINDMERVEMLHNTTGDWPGTPENGHGTNPSCGVGNLPRSHYNEARH